MIQIVKATSCDAKDVIDFSKICGSETDNLTFGAEGISFTVEEEATFLNSIYDSKNNLFLLAKNGNEIVGTASYSVSTFKRMCHRGEVGICIKKSYWNKGIGSMLLEKILFFAKKKANSEIISLEVRSDNKAAIHLYEKYGFKKIGTFKGYFKVNGKMIDFDFMQLCL